MKNNKKLKIVYLDFDDVKNPLLNAGQARATFEVGKRLSSMGHEVTVYCARYPGYKDRVENGIHYMHISIGTKYIRVNNLLYIISLPFYVRRIKADVIIESFVAPISTLCSPLFTKTPVIGLPTMFNAKAFSKKYLLPFYWIERFGCRFYKYFLPYTTFDEAKMKKVNKHIISRVVPEGVDERFFKIKRVKPKHVLFLGRYDIHQKGIDLLLKAYKLVSDKMTYPLVLAGKGVDQNKIHSMIQNLGLENKVKLVGPAYGNKKEKLLSESIAVAFPSRHEGFPLFSLEALAAGLAILSFDIPGLSWIPNSIALKTAQFDIEGYSKLLSGLSNSKNIESMGIKAKVFAKKYTWDFVAEQFEDFIEFVLIDAKKRKEK